LAALAAIGATLARADIACFQSLVCRINAAPQFAAMEQAQISWFEAHVVRRRKPSAALGWMERQKYSERMAGGCAWAFPTS
jgi:hypothetical protein